MLHRTSAVAPALEAPSARLLDRASLFLDFDGTLAPLAPRPDAVEVDERLPAILRALDLRLQGRIAIVTGRAVADARALLADMTLSISGSHGAETEWADGRRDGGATPAWIAAAAARMLAFARRRRGVIVEVKPYGIALHYRQAPDAAAACHRLAEELADDAAIQLQHGKMMVELRMAGADKGDALRAFMADPHMAGTRPLMIGDDLTDEPAFAAAVALGGAGILVGDPRETAARYILPDVAAVLDWLAAAAAEVAA